MLKKWAQIWFDADKGDGAGAGGNADGGGKKPEDKPADKTFAQSDVDRIAGDARKAGRESGVNDLLKELGFEKADDLKTLIADAKKRADAEKSELDKASEQIANLAKAKEAAETRAAEVAAKAQTTLMRAAVLSEASKADYNFKPEALADVWTFVDRTSIKAVAGSSPESGESFEGVAEALKAVAKAKPYLCNEAKPGQGTPRRGPEKQSGNGGGQTPARIGVTL